MRHKNVGRTFFRFVTINRGQTDGRTDRLTERQTAFSWLYRLLHYMQSHGRNQNGGATRE